MNFFISLILIISTAFLSKVYGESYKDDPEYQRLKGFQSYQSRILDHDKEREKGESEYIKTQVKWDEMRLKALTQHKQVIKQTSPLESGPEHQEYVREKQQYNQKLENERKKYVATKKLFDRSEHKELVPEIEELDLVNKRPRFEVRKRNKLYGEGSGRPSTINRGSSVPNRPAFNSNSDFPPPPPPPSFGDFGDQFPPPPQFSDGYGDDIPPPPPPPGFEDDDEFVPPPPPPPF